MTALAASQAGIKSVCDAVGLRPAIRYAAASPQARELASGLSELFSGIAVQSSHQVLILDRRDDAFTPLLLQVCCMEKGQI